LRGNELINVQIIFSQALSITIPSSVTSIGDGALNGCSGLITVDGNNPNYASQDGLLYNKKMTTLIQCPISKTGNFNIPSSVTSIGNSAFSNCLSLANITIPSSVSSIGDHAFRYCTALINVDSNNTKYASQDGLLYNKTMTTLIQCPTSKTGNFNIPSSVTSIGEAAFTDCTGLTSITIPSTVTSIGAAFLYCTGLTSINYNAINCKYGNFSGCTSLANVIIGDNVQTIPDFAFSDCTGLTSIIIPSSITYIGTSAFYNTAWLKNQSNGLIYVGKVAYCYKGTMPSGTSISLAEGTTSISGRAFEGCTGLTNITIPSSVTSIGDYTFYNCSGLTSIIIPSAITSIGECAFNGCTSLTTVNYNAINCTNMGSSQYPSFFGCTKLSSVIIGNNVKTIPANAFQDCTGLTSIIIPTSVTSINDAAFEYCSGLTSITIPSSVTGIGSFAFFYCTGLTSINIPSSVTSIGNEAFYNCTGLRIIYSYATVPVNLSNTYYVFANVNKTTCTLYVPKGSQSAYKTAAYWNEFINIVEFDASAVNNPVNTTAKITYNSATGAIQIQGSDAPVQVSVYNMNGMLVKSGVVSSGESLPVQSLPRGIYVVKGLVNNGVVSEKVVI
ncbi:MAG: leucine-rich repeat domain-containing protein, partial [Paludibacter sp.]